MSRAMTAVGNDRDEVLGRRIGAGLIDLVVVVALLVVLGLLIGENETGNGRVQVSLNGGPALVWGGLSLLYYFASEAISGRTLGKRLLGIRVAAADGARAGAGKIAVRTAFRLIDGIGFYLIGLIMVLASGKRRQRLGDLAAGTNVVAG
jgi:uncharacterized RDD family membrane protein YckC